MNISVYNFELKALNSLHLAAFSGPAFRGGFGAVLRQLTCVTGLPDCASCPVFRDCPFTDLFNCPPPADDAYFKKEANVPRPFVIEAPATREVSHGEHVQFKVVLSGRTAMHLPYVVLAYRQLGLVGFGKGRGRYRLISVKCVDPLNQRLPAQIFDGAEQRLYPSNSFSTSLEAVKKHYGAVDARKLIVHFRSPTHLKTRGRAPQEPPEFEHLVRAVLRRHSDLAALYGEGRPDMDYRALVDKARDVKLAASNLRYFRQRGYSHRKGEETPTEGITGSVTYEGELAPFMPYLIFGQWLHVGKQATFGMGKYELELAA